jgi:hypothetical protein
LNSRLNFRLITSTLPFLGHDLIFVSTKPDEGHSDLSGISQTELNDVARLMNQRPRKTLGWRTPEEAMAEDRAAFKSTDALET